jgi:hypothetical protein
LASASGSGAVRVEEIEKDDDCDDGADGEEEENFDV